MRSKHKIPIINESIVYLQTSQLLSSALVRITHTFLAIEFSLGCSTAQCVDEIDSKVRAGRRGREEPGKKRGSATRTLRERVQRRVARVTGKNLRVAIFSPFLARFSLSPRSGERARAEEGGGVSSFDETTRGPVPRFHPRFFGPLSPPSPAARTGRSAVPFASDDRARLTGTGAFIAADYRGNDANGREYRSENVIGHR